MNGFTWRSPLPTTNSDDVGTELPDGSPGLHTHQLAVAAHCWRGHQEMGGTLLFLLHSFQTPMYASNGINEKGACWQGCLADMAYELLVPRVKRRDEAEGQQKLCAQNS